MSLILDALNRSRTDTVPGEVPGLQARHDTPENPSGTWKKIAVLIALALGGAAVGWWLSQSDGQTEQPPALVAPAELAVERESPPVAQAKQPTAMNKTPTNARPANTQPVVRDLPRAKDPATSEAREPAVAALYERNAALQARRVQAQRAQSAPLPASDVDGAKRSESEPPAQATPKSAAPVASEDTEETIDIEQMLSLAREEMARETLAEHSAPWIGDLSQTARDSIPTIYYREHDYSSQRGQAAVVLNDGRFREGQQVAPGLRLTEILPGSIVLDYRGQTFRLRALNSWINL